MSVRRRLGLLAVAQLNVAAVLLAPDAGAVRAVGGSATPATCATPTPVVPLERAVETRPGDVRTAVADLGAGTRGRVGAQVQDARVDGDAAAVDPALWLGSCGQLKFREEARAAASRPVPAWPVGPAQAGRNLDVLDLHSRPGSARTIFLDVDGARVEGTVWNEDTGTPVITAAP